MLPWFSSRLTLIQTTEAVPPPFTTAAATFILVAYTIIYVAPFYLSSTTRPSLTLSRDAPSVIRARIRSVTLSCIVCCSATFIALISFKKGPDGVRVALHNMGLFPVGVIESARSLALLFLLFTGPLFEAAVVEGAWRDWIQLRGFSELFGSWMGYRNLVAGPITEEVLFRGAAVPLFLLSRASVSTMVFLTPTIFGLAHIHHFYEFRISHPHTSIAASVARSIFQFSYTFLFGSFATFLYLRTGSLLAVTLAHAFCNWMGLPRIWGRVGGETSIIGPDVGQEDDKRDGLPSTTTPAAAVKAGGTLMTLAYYVLLILGAWLFYKNLWILTDSKNALVDF